MQEAQVLMSYWHNDDMFVVSDVYTQAEKEHLYDVKKLLVGLRYILLVVGFWLLVSGLWLYFRGFDISRFFTAFRMTVVGFVIFGLLLFVVGWVAWDWLFDLFHRTFFVDNWLFPADSFLIQSYPWEFFRNAMVVVLIRSVGLFLVLGLVFFIVEKREKLI